jgi:hypothetical protein
MRRILRVQNVQAVQPLRSVQAPFFIFPRVEGGHSCPPPSFGGLENPPSHKEDIGGGGLNPSAEFILSSAEGLRTDSAEPLEWFELFKESSL